MRLTDIKVPNFKFPKIKMKGIEDLPEVNINFNDIEKHKENKKLKKKKWKVKKNEFKRYQST